MVRGGQCRSGRGIVGSRALFVEGVDPGDRAGEQVVGTLEAGGEALDAFVGRGADDVGAGARVSAVMFSSCGRDINLMSMEQ